MIVAYSRGGGAATSYEIAWVTVAPQHLRVGNDSWARIDPCTDGCRAHPGGRLCASSPRKMTGH